MRQDKAKIVEKAVIATFSKRRQELGYTYEKVGELAGLHRTSISLIERGKVQPTLIVCVKIAEALGLKLDEVIKGDC